jgi:hypothetical protein
MPEESAQSNSDTPARVPLRDRFRRQPVGRVVVVAIFAILGVMLIGATWLTVATGTSGSGSGVPTSPEHLTTAQPSPIVGLPVPKQAQWDGPTYGKSAEYTIPSRMKTVMAWYLDRLPEGQPWHGWSWVKAGQPCAGTLQNGSVWQWARQGSTLAITVYPSPADPPFADVTLYIEDRLPLCSPANP